MRDDEGWLAAEELVRCCAEVRLAAGHADDDASVWLGDPSRRRAVVELAAPTSAHLARVVGASWGTPGVLVADRLGAEQRRLLSDAGWGWLDRRGRLRVEVEGTVVESDVTPLLAGPAEVADPLDRPATRAVLLRLLRTPDEVPSVRALAAATRLSVGAVGGAMSDLRSDGLVVDGRVRARVGFARLRARWRPRWVPLAAAPVDLAPAPARLLGLELEDPSRRGWASVGHHAARAHGAAVPEDREVLRVLVPDGRALHWAERLLGVASGDGAALEAAVAPVPTALDGRREWVRTRRRPPIPLAAPVVVAWTLAAADRDDLLDAWDHDGDEPGVW